VSSALLSSGTGDVVLGPAALIALKALLVATRHEPAEKALRDFLRRCAAKPVVMESADPAPTCSAAAARRVELIARGQHREYDALVSDLRRDELDQQKHDSFGAYKQQLAMGSSVFLSLFSAVALGYYFGQRLFGDSPSKVWACAACCGFVLLIVEVALVIFKLQASDGKRKEKGV
jgi:hypothetical protein